MYAYSIPGRAIRDSSLLQFIQASGQPVEDAPRCTLVLGAAGARGKTTLALWVAGCAPRATYRTRGIDVLFHGPREYVVDTPAPLGTIHPAVITLLRDASDALVVHSPNARAADTHRLLLALRAIHKPALLVVRRPADALHCGAPVACVNCPADAQRAMRPWPCEVPILCAALCTAQIPHLAHATALAIAAIAYAVPTFPRPHANVPSFLTRAQQCGGDAYEPCQAPRPFAGTGNAVLALIVGVAVASVHHPATCWAAFALPAPLTLAACVRGPLAMRFVCRPVREQVSALALLLMLQITRTPLPRSTMVGSFALAAVLCAAGAPLHAGPVLLAAVMRGNALPHRDVALVIAGLVARKAHLAILLAVACVVALDDDARRLRASWSAWVCPLIVLLTIG